MKSNDIIDKIRKVRHDFAEAHGNDLEEMAKAVAEMVDRSRFKVVSASAVGLSPR